MPDKQAENREENGQFKPGLSGNPSGRPPKIKCIPDILLSIGEEEIDTKEGNISKLEAVLRMVFKKAFEGQNWAVQFIADRTEGKAVERTADVSGEWQKLVEALHEPE